MINKNLLIYVLSMGTLYLHQNITFEMKSLFPRNIYISYISCKRLHAGPCHSQNNGTKVRFLPVRDFCGKRTPRDSLYP